MRRAGSISKFCNSTMLLVEFPNRLACNGRNAVEMTLRSYDVRRLCAAALSLRRTSSLSCTYSRKRRDWLDSRVHSLRGNSKHQCCFTNISVEKKVHFVNAYLAGPRGRHPVNVLERGHSGTTYRRLLQVSKQVPIAPEQAGQGVLVTVLACQGLRAVDDGDPVEHTE